MAAGLSLLAIGYSFTHSRNSVFFVVVADLTARRGI